MKSGNEFSRQLGERLKTLRGPISQAEIAKQLGMKQPQWARYESGTSAPSAEILMKICALLLCSSDELLGLPVRSRRPTVSHNTGAVAIGTGARASLKSEASSKSCAKCPYKKLATAFKKLP